MFAHEVDLALFVGVWGLVAAGELITAVLCFRPIVGLVGVELRW